MTRNIEHRKREAETLGARNEGETPSKVVRPSASRRQQIAQALDEAPARAAAPSPSPASASAPVTTTNTTAPTSAAGAEAGAPDKAQQAAPTSFFTKNKNGESVEIDRLPLEPGAKPPVGKTTAEERNQLTKATIAVAARYNVKGEEQLLEWLSQNMAEGGLTTNAIFEIVSEAKSKRKIQFVRKLLRKWSTSPAIWRKVLIGSRHHKRDFLEPSHEAINEVVLNRKHQTPTLALTTSPTLNRHVRDKESQDGEKTAIRKGVYTFEEREILMTAIKQYCTSQGLEDTAMLLPSRSGPKRPEVAAKTKNAWVEIAKALPNRSLKSIYAFGTRILDEGNRKGAWTEAEDAILMRLVEEKGRKWADISHYFGRSPEAVHLHFRTISKGAAQRKGQWTEAELELLMDSINNEIESAGLNPEDWNPALKLLDTELKHRCCLPWTKISNHVGSRTAQQCKDKYYQNMVSVTKSGKWAGKDDATLIMKLNKVGATSAQEVPWDKLWNKYSPSLLQARWDEMSKAAVVPKGILNGFENQVKYLMKNYLPELMDN